MAGLGAGRRTARDAGFAGNLLQRSLQWDSASFVENFSYDNLNRLATSQVLGQPLLSFTFDAAGNLASKPGAGTYSYPAQGPGSVRPHAVLGLTGVPGVFSYDDNGNLLSGAGRSASWSSFDMPLVLSIAGANASSSSFEYGPEHQRVRQVRTDAAGTTVTVYAGAQEAITRAGQTTVRSYWPGVGSDSLGLEVDAPAAATALLWTHTDRLGSVVALSDSAGMLQERLAYDPWGKRRTTDGSATPDSLDGSVDNKGFTGHEMLDQLELVHMNGRVFDPFNARFLSADPLVLDPSNGQAFNRYSYVLNNPTNLTDPSGFKQQCPEDSTTTGSRLGCGTAGLDFDSHTALKAANASRQQVAENGQNAQRAGQGRPNNANGGDAPDPKSAAKGVTAGDVASNLWNGGDNWIGLTRNLVTAAGTTAWNLANFLGAGVAGDSQWAADSADALLNKDRGATVATAMLLAGGRLGGSRSAAEGLEIAPGKFDYLFGRVTSSEHNAARSNQLALEMKRLGVPDTAVGQKMLSDHLALSARAEGNLVRSYSNQYGKFEVRDSLFMGPSGKAARFESTFQVLEDGTRRLSTVIPFH